MLLVAVKISDGTTMRVLTLDPPVEYEFGTVVFEEDGDTCAILVRLPPGTLD
jgi:hypothetical protein